MILFFCSPSSPEVWETLERIAELTRTNQSIMRSVDELTAAFRGLVEVGQLSVTTLHEMEYHLARIDAELTSDYKTAPRRMKKSVCKDIDRKLGLTRARFRPGDRKRYNRWEARGHTARQRLWQLQQEDRQLPKV